MKKEIKKKVKKDSSKDNDDPYTRAKKALSRLRSRN